MPRFIVVETVEYVVDGVDTGEEAVAAIINDANRDARCSGVRDRWYEEHPSAEHNDS